MVEQRRRAAHLAEARVSLVHNQAAEHVEGGSQQATGSLVVPNTEQCMPLRHRQGTNYTVSKLCHTSGSNVQHDACRDSTEVQRKHFIASA